ncbi:MAG: hypothetical protein IT168_19470 [Bryobacterales bacterium]|nr:hypothetical protein [Bryobacterales bacterium]
MNTQQQELVPLYWPDGWTEAQLVAESPFNCLMVEGTQSAAPMQEGLRIVTDAPSGVKLAEGVLPRVKTARNDSGAVEAGPTGKPWLEFNGWDIQLKRALEPGKAVWMTFDVSKGAASEDMYLRSVAECAAYGGRWVVKLDQQLADSLSRKDPGALKTWRKICDLSNLFKKKAEWRQWQPVAAVGVISTFAGDNEFLSQEFLKLALRRPLPLRILPAARAAELSWDGLQAIVVADDGPLPPSIAAKLKTFKGRVFLQSQKKWDDPYVMAEDVHLTFGREHDVIRPYNATAANVHYTQSLDAKRGVVHMVAFGQPSRDITLAVNKRWRAARLYTPDILDGRPIKVVPSRFGSEFALPHFRCWAAIELEA